jgi:hypothetical protein
MEYPEVNIDSSLIQVYKKEKAWLEKYSEEISAFNNPLGSPRPRSEAIQPEYFDQAIKIKNLSSQNLAAGHRIYKLEEELKQKNLLIAEIISKNTFQQFQLEAKAKIFEDDLNLHKKKLLDKENELKITQEQLNNLIQDYMKPKIDPENEELKSKVKLLIDELNSLKTKSIESQNLIQIQTNRISLLEKEKIKALALYQSKEKKMREEIESSYNIVELTQKFEYCHSKMKDYQEMYLSSKSNLNIIEEQLLKTLNYNFSLETELKKYRIEASEISNAYMKLKEDYQRVAIKSQSISESHSKLLKTVSKEKKASEAIKRENYHLRVQLRSLAEGHSNSIFTFTSIEDLIVKQTQLILKLENYSKKIKKLELENQNLNRTLDTFKNSTHPTSISNEENRPEI